MTEQSITPDIAPTDAMPIPQTAAEDEHTHAGVHDANLHHSPEEIKREVRVYIAVFVGLMILTGATVGACYGLKLPVHYAITVALIIAAMKGFLVAGFFMHLLTEKKVIYGILALTVLFFIVLLALPVNDVLDKFGRY